MSGAPYDEDTALTAALAFASDPLDWELAAAMVNAMKNRTVVAPEAPKSRKRRVTTVHFDRDWEVDFCTTDAPSKVAKTVARRLARS